jgi:hypothetical protein
MLINKIFPESVTCHHVIGWNFFHGDMINNFRQSCDQSDLTNYLKSKPNVHPMFGYFKTTLHCREDTMKQNLCIVLARE